MTTTRTISSLLISCCLLVSLTECKKENTKTFTIYKPVYKNKVEVLSDINGSASEQITTAGKIYVKDNFIFINDVDKGIHVFDNSNPVHPIPIAFLKIPGNQDIAVKGNILYADMYGDLLAIDISNPRKGVITSDLVGIFNDRQYVNGTMPDNTKVIVDWIKKDTIVLADYSYNPCRNCQTFDLATSSSFFSPTGVAGSMARMVLMNDELYAIAESHSLNIINTSIPKTPYLVSYMFAGFDLQTIYPFQNRLFLGSAVGMFMFDVSDPEHPSSLGSFSHGRACDPVITDGDYAYVTLHAGTFCGGSDNELNIINVKDLMDPKLIRSYPMTSPTGLSKDGDLLFVCDGTEGVKVYDAKQVSELILLTTLKAQNPYDIITSNKKALIIAKDGLYQYDYSNQSHPRLVSVIKTTKN